MRILYELSWLWKMLGIALVSAYAILMDIDGNKIDFSAMLRGYKTPKLSNCKRVTARSSQIIWTVAV